MKKNILLAAILAAFSIAAFAGADDVKSVQAAPVAAAPAPVVVNEILVIDENKADENIYSIGFDETHISVAGQRMWGNRFTGSIVGAQKHHALGRDWQIGVIGTIAQYTNPAVPEAQWWSGPTLNSASTFDAFATTKISEKWSANIRGGLGITSGALNDQSLPAPPKTLGSPSTLTAGYDFGLGAAYSISKNFNVNFGFETTNAYMIQAWNMPITSMSRATAQIVSAGVTYQF